VYIGRPSARRSDCMTLARLAVLSPSSAVPALYTMDRVLTNTSRAAKEVMMPMPIFQSKPRGLRAGSIARPIRPAKDCRSRSPDSSRSKRCRASACSGVGGFEAVCFHRARCRSKRRSTSAGRG